ncbi:MAG: hypothetical protein ACTS68_01135 [Candidatus Hodgkinia cicadicola]
METQTAKQAAFITMLPVNGPWVAACANINQKSPKPSFALKPSVRC